MSSSQLASDRGDDAAASPRCACVTFCGDVPEKDDDPNAHCKGLSRSPEKLVELVTVPRV